MLSTNITLADKYDYLNERFKAAYAFLKRTDLADLEPGAYELSGKDVVAKVMNITTAEASTRRFETHDDFFDIQFVISGEERCDYAKRSQMTEKEAYNPEKDVTFYHEPESFSTLNLYAGDYIIVAPEDAHRPGCAVNAPCDVKKVVVKIRV